MDFSETRDQLADDKFKERFFAGVPNIPPKDKDKMAIYLLFIQHILFSLKDNGKAAIVLPAGFLTDKTGIELKIKKEIVDNNYLTTIIQMPPNIFATTGTNVFILFIEKTSEEKEIFMVDASKLGKKVKEGKNQRTILKQSDFDRIVDVVNNRKVEEHFSTIASKEEIISKNYSLTVGQYYKLNIKKESITKQQAKENIKKINSRLKELYKENEVLGENISKMMEIIYND